MKLFKTSNLDIVRYWQNSFASSYVPSVILVRCKIKYEVKFDNVLSNKYNSLLCNIW